MSICAPGPVMGNPLFKPFELPYVYMFAAGSLIVDGHQSYHVYGTVCQL